VDWHPGTPGKEIRGEGKGERKKKKEVVTARGLTREPCGRIPSAPGRYIANWVPRSLDYYREKSGGKKKKSMKVFPLRREPPGLLERSTGQPGRMRRAGFLNGILD